MTNHSKAPIRSYICPIIASGVVLTIAAGSAHGQETLRAAARTGQSQTFVEQEINVPCVGDASVDAARTDPGKLSQSSARRGSVFVAINDGPDGSGVATADGSSRRIRIEFGPEASLAALPVGDSGLPEVIIPWSVETFSDTPTEPGSLRQSVVDVDVSLDVRGPQNASFVSISGGYDRLNSPFEFTFDSRGMLESVGPSAVVVTVFGSETVPLTTGSDDVTYLEISIDASIDTLSLSQAFANGSVRIAWNDDPSSWIVAGTGQTLADLGVSATFCIFCPADVNQDGSVDGLDFGAWLGAFNAMDPIADQNLDGMINGLDFGAWLGNFNAGCD